MRAVKNREKSRSLHNYYRNSKHSPPLQLPDYWQDTRRGFSWEYEQLKRKDLKMLAWMPPKEIVNKITLQKRYPPYAYKASHPYFNTPLLIQTDKVFLVWGLTRHRDHLVLIITKQPLLTRKALRTEK